MGDLTSAILLAALAGAAIPLGAWLARFDRLLPGPIRHQANHWIMAFGAGALLSAVALVLIPEGTERLHGLVALLPFLMGAVIALSVDVILSRNGGSKAQLLAMLMDFIPETIALGAILTADPKMALLLAAMIGAQNLPEGFNADRELADGSVSRAKRLALFIALIPLGPIAALAGLSFFADSPTILGGLMLFSAGGILYLIFQDIAPQVPIKHIWSPPLGAILGFVLGLAGHILTG
ncbi:ZIP family metal transporter [Aliiroseovarius crassostreae]|uniref:ZIP family metal transporter n=1 Tax=Aliiroseovarius crassostreae TaxID=154981 RepID=UPI003C7C906B